MLGVSSPLDIALIEPCDTVKKVSGALKKSIREARTARGALYKYSDQAINAGLVARSVL